MSISSVTSKVIYVGDSSTATLAYPFRILAEGDLTVSRYVTLTSVASALTLNTDYAVTGVGVAGGGNVLLTGSYAGGMPTGSNTIIQRVVDLTQTVDYVENDPFPADTHENAIDKLCMSSQQLQEQIDRCIIADVNQLSSNVVYTDFVDQSVAVASSATVAVAKAADAAVQASNAAVSAALASSNAATASTGSLQVSFDGGQSISIADGNDTPLIITNDDTTNDPNTVNVLNSSSGIGVYINQVGTFAASKKALYVYSAAAQTSANVHLMHLNYSSTASTADVQYIENEGTGQGIWIDQDGVLAGGKHALHVDCSAANVNADSAAVRILQDNAASTEPALEIKHDGEGGALEIEAADNSAAHIRLTGDCANAAPTDGDIWFDGTSLKIRIGSTTATLATD